MKKSLFFRKVNQIYSQKIKKDVGDYFPVLINSFPKSGTHLLFQLFEKNSNRIKDYKTFIASMPSISQKERSRLKTIKLINSIVAGELVRAHLFYHSDIENILFNKKIIHYFIYRDPRDVVISEANYLYDMNKWHRLHKYFKKFPNLDDRIMFSIKGNSFYKTYIKYPNIVERFNKYKGWLTSKNVYSIKYENLVGANRDDEICKIMNYYIHQLSEELYLDDLVSKAIANLDPSKSHTFREGGTQKWKKYFNEEHKELFKEIGGQLLIDLNYEKDLNW